jgi:hypothetical protein
MEMKMDLQKSRHMKKIILTITILGVLIVTYCNFFRKPEVVLVHNEKEMTVIVAKDFPFTQTGRIRWWKENERIIKEKYHIPNRNDGSVYYIAILDINHGLKKVSEADYTSWYSLSKDDLFCFDEIKSERRCIEKNVLMEITVGLDGSIGYIFEVGYVD